MRRFLLLAIVPVILLSGCHRSDDEFDNRTLENRSHVETVHPVDKKDPFRP